MRFYLLTAAASMLAATSAVAAPANVTFSDQEGSRYEYAQSRDSDGSIELHGKVVDTGEAFALRIYKGRVSGTMGNRPVSFTVSKADMANLDASTPTTIASN
jgi:hypothetical protein